MTNDQIPITKGSWPGRAAVALGIRISSFIGHWSLVIAKRSLRSPSWRSGLNKDQFGFAPAQGEMISANFDFQRIAQRSKPNQFDRRPNQQSHLQQTGTMFGSDFDFGDCRKTADGEGGQRAWFGGHTNASCSSRKAAVRPG